MNFKGKNRENTGGLIFNYLKVLTGFLLLSFFIFSIDIYQKYKNSLDAAKVINKHYLESKKIWFEQQMQSVMADFNFLGKMPSMKGYLVNRNSIYLEDIAENLISLAESRGLYNYIKLLDENGNEKLVINNRDQTYRIPTYELRNDSKESYYLQSRYLPSGKVYVSDFELNRENGKTEVPGRPVINVSAILFNKYEIPSGIIVITLDGNKILERLRDQSQEISGKYMVISKRGTTILGENQDSDWSLILNNKKENGFDQKYPEDWNLLTQKSDGDIEIPSGFLAFNSIYTPGSLDIDNSLIPTNLSEPGIFLKIMIKMSEEQIAVSRQSAIQNEYVYILIYSIISLIGGLYLAIILHNRNKNLVKLKADEDNFKKAQHLAVIGNWWYDILGKRSNWSDELYNILGYPEQSIDPDIEYIIKLIHPDDMSATVEVLRNSVENHEEHHIIFRIILPGGKIKYLLSVASVEMEGRDPYKIYGIIQDITTLKNIEEELKTMKSAADYSNQAKTEFLTNIIKEIKGSMSVITGFSKSLMRDITDARNRYYLKSIYISGKLLMNLSQDIVALSNLEIGRTKTSRSSVNIRNQINEVREIFRLRMGSKSLKFFIDIDPEMPTEIVLDDVGLKHVLISLVSNAVKFTDKGFILITCRKKYISVNKNKLDLLITVEDTGSGFDERSKSNYLRKIIKSDEDEVAQSSLGLSITSRLVYLMNGELDIQSAPGRGTVVKIKIPGVIVPGVEINNKDINPLEEDSYIENISLDDFSRSRILIIATGEERSSLRNYFSGGLIEILEGADEKDCKNILSKELPDAILMVPTSSSSERDYSFLQWKNSGQNKNIPVILILHQSTKKDHTFSQLKKSADEIIYMPLNKSELLLALARYLPFHESEDSGELILNLGGITDKEKKDLSELLNILQNKLGHIWEKVSTLLVKTDIEEFVSEVLELGRTFNYRPLYKWGSELDNQVQVFDTISILNTLKQYPEIVNNLRKYGA